MTIEPPEGLLGVDFRRARAFATEWYAAWASRDAPRILDLYADDVVFVSPSVAVITGETAGTLEGKSALRRYLMDVLERFSDLTFEPQSLMLGIDCITMYYHGILGLEAAETVRFRGSKIIRSDTSYSELEQPWT